MSVTQKRRTVRKTLTVSKQIHTRKAGSNRKKATRKLTSAPNRHLTRKAIAAKKSAHRRPGIRLRKNRTATSKGKVRSPKVSPHSDAAYSEEYNKGFNSGYEEGFKVGHAKGSEDGLEQAYGELDPK